MKNKDNELLAEAYMSLFEKSPIAVTVLDEDFKKFLKKAAPYAVLAASALTSNMAKATDQPYPVNQSSVYQSQTVSQPSKVGDILPAAHVKSFTSWVENSITQGSQSQVTGVLVNIIQTKVLASGEVEMVIEVSGDILASSQEEANKKSQEMIQTILEKEDMSITGLTLIEQEQHNFPFHLRFQLKTPLRK